MMRRTAKLLQHHVRRMHASQAQPTNSIPFKTIAALGIVGVWCHNQSDATLQDIKHRLNDFIKIEALDTIKAVVNEILYQPEPAPKIKLLPDWPMTNLGIPADFPPVPVLVLAVENVLMYMEYDIQNGWTMHKRPFVDEFLWEMSRYYEIVLFSNQSHMIISEFFAKLDPKGCGLHYLTREATQCIDGCHVKNLDHLNRSIGKIIVLDYDAANFQLHPANGVVIPKYDKPDEQDTVLQRLMPALVSIGKANPDDVTKFIV